MATQTWDVGLQHFQVPSKVCTGETKEKLSITFNNFANLTSGMLENFIYILKKTQQIIKDKDNCLHRILESIYLVRRQQKEVFQLLVFINIFLQK